MNLTSATTLSASKNKKLKRQRRKVQKLNFDRKNKDCYNHSRQKEAKEVSESKWAVYKREKRIMTQESRSNNKIRQPFVGKERDFISAKAV